ncbi:uncharacterized protein LOC129586524 [Paramacrobiotus metropolitanus]|uniref:uncharacterized protein LOC129586524 n=1 Tax=Paramacrobiotus metropolitanus TaxID=2943436 RepID=UPI002445D888|nr:uncharacterized protein LOC129586524 [Paramacrobiotus metropolitanus]
MVVHTSKVEILGLLMFVTIATLTLPALVAPYCDLKAQSGCDLVSGLSCNCCLNEALLFDCLDRMETRRSETTKPPTTTTTTPVPPPTTIVAPTSTLTLRGTDTSWDYNMRHCYTDYNRPPRVCEPETGANCLCCHDPKEHKQCERKMNSSNNPVLWQ